MKTKFWAVGLACFLVFCAAPASALAGSISGQVTNAATGMQMDEVTACAEPVEGSGHCVGVPANGEYTIEGLEAGEYQVSFQPSFELNYVRQYYPGTIYPEDATLVSLGSTEDLTGINAAIEEGATLTGTVVGEGGVGALGEVKVCADEIGGPGYQHCGLTESDGTYRIISIPAGTYKVVFENEAGGIEYAHRYYDEKSFEAEAEEIGLEAGEEFTADATMIRSGSIEGIATEEGRPLESLFVCGYTAAHVSVGCTFTEADGSYHWKGLPVGSYILELEDFGQPLQFSGGAETFAEATPVTVGAGATAIENFELLGPPGISGTVTDAATGDPIGGGFACATAPTVGTSCVQVESNGEYELLIGAGTYDVYFEANGYLHQYWDGVFNESEATPVTVGTSSLVTGIDGELSRAGMINGHVTLAGAGTNLSSVNACALDQSGVAVECATTNSSGEYTLRELPAGEYKVRFTRNGYGTQYYNGKATLADAEPLAVVAGETKSGVNAAMVKLVKPANTSRPEISGVGKVGETLSCSQGVWSNGPTAYEFYWYRSGREIRGAVASTYKLTTTDAGKAIKCGVVAENGAGPSSVVESAAAINVLAIRQLTVTKVGSGTVTSAPAAIECGSTCTASGNETESITLTAAPAAHFEFTGWSGACSGVGACEVTFGAANSSVTATFAPITHSVSVAVTGSGSVSADSGAISGCTEAGGTCSGSYDEDTVVTLTATPDAHQQFTGWTGCTTESGTECTFTVGGTENITATFAPITHPVSVAVTGSGTVSADSGAISGCTEAGGTCSGDYEEGTEVTLTATSDPHHTFTGWTGCDSETGDECTFTVGGAENITATFAPITHPVSVAVTGSGTVSADSGVIGGCTEAGGTCSGDYEEGSEVTLTATPGAHQAFTGWTGCMTATGTECAVTVEAAANVTATFAPIVDRLSVAKAGDGSGTVTSSPAGIDCGATCAAGFDDGTAVTLVAVADAGSEFTGWSGAGCSGTAACVITLGESASVVANFAKKPAEPAGSGDNGGSSGGGSAGSGSSGTPSSPPAAPPAPKHVTKKKPLQCKKGFHKVKVKGKVRCAKAKPAGKKAKGKKRP